MYYAIHHRRGDHKPGVMHFEADSAAEAEADARKLGYRPTKVEPLPDYVPPAWTLLAADAPDSMFGDDSDNALEHSPETGVFPHDA